MKTSERVKLNYQQILFVFVAFLAMTLVSYFYVSDIVRKQMQLIGDASMDTTQTAVSASLTETELLFANVVQAVESMLATQKTNADIMAYLTDINAYFNAERSPLPDFMKVYGYIRNQWLDGSGWTPPPDYVPESRPWHIGAAANDGRIFFSEPYIDAETGGMCISFSQQVKGSANVVYGILAVDLQLSRITDHVQRQTIAGNGYGVLIDDNLNFIVHRNKALVGASMTTAGGDYARLSRLFDEDRPLSAVRFRDADGTDSVVFFRKVFNDWHIGVIIPRTDYYREVYTLAAVLGVMGFILAAILSYFLVRTHVEKMRSMEESRSKSSFLARMSHEMRTPMNAIIGMTDIARASDDPEKKQYCLDKISDASTHLLGVINDVLDMSKIEAGKLELSETDFALKAMLRQVETVVQYKMEEKHQHFSIHVNKDVPAAIVADRQRLAQVITNLVSNANKFTPDGGHIHLQVTRLPDVDNRCALQFVVTDNGIGIPEAQQEKLFHSFEQADGSISRKYGGTGLGLAISQKIVQVMGGTIRVESAPERGASFVFTIQAGIGVAAEEPEARHETPEPGTDAPIFVGKRILVAEDVDINREILIAFLDGTGLAIDTAENGIQVCERFMAAPDAYDLIFMDIHMPECDGYEATRKIRAMDLSKARTIPIVAMTANVFREDVEKCYAVGMNGHVGKPVKIDEVLTTLKNFLGTNAKNTSQ
ncbi:response regulator [Desulfosarcina sp. OttesenSCG-928-B08]|nr:response regulator [Desulfosarcina sp. OttesenSCG-928-B08]